MSRDLAFRLERFARRGRCRDWPAFAAGREAFVASVGFGVRMELRTADALSELIYCRFFEWNERALMRRLLRPGDLVVDAGANVGLHTLTAARCVGRGGCVIAVEPHARAGRLLAENVRRFAPPGSVRIVPAALGEAPGRASLHARPGRSAWAHLGGDGAGEAVDVVTLDRLLGEHAPARPCALVKIDVEGSERSVLAGARALLARHDAPVLVVEFSAEGSAATGQSQAALRAAVEARGYTLWRIGAGTLAPLAHGEHEYVNALCVPPGGAFAARCRGLVAAP